MGASARGKCRVFTDFRVLARKGLGVLSLCILFPNFIKVLKRHQLCFKRLIGKKKKDLNKLFQRFLKWVALTFLVY